MKNLNYLGGLKGAFAKMEREKNKMNHNKIKVKVFLSTLIQSLKEGKSCQKDY